MTITASGGIVFVSLLAVHAATCAQQLTQLAPGLRQSSGIESTQRIAYSRIFLEGSLVLTDASTKPERISEENSRPELIAQCTKDAYGKLRFELMMHFGGVTDTAYYPPWKSTGRDDPFPPRTETTSMTMNFLGYTKVKPVARQWELSLHVPGVLRYNPPSKGSHNLEEIAFYMQYLKALPTLRISRAAAVAQFETAPLLAAMHNEPLCWASGV